MNHALAFLAATAILGGCSGNSSSSSSVVPPAGNSPKDVASASPSPAGTATPTPGVTPTPAATSTPAPTATPVPTATPSHAPTPFPTYPGYIHLAPGAVIGAANAFTPHRGDAWPGSSAGTAGQTIDGISCQPTMTENQFHVHAYVGVLVNGAQVAVPDSIGMNGPGPVVNGTVNAARCFYAVHTHDATGMIHMEQASTTTNTGSLFTLGNLLDIWDQPLTQNGFAGFSGMVEMFYVPRPKINTTYVSGYQAYTGDPYQLPFYSHTAVWIEIGPPYVDATHLPQVRFYTEY